MHPQAAQRRQTGCLQAAHRLALRRRDRESHEAPLQVGEARQGQAPQRTQRRQAARLLRLGDNVIPVHSNQEAQLQALQGGQRRGQQRALQEADLQGGQTLLWACHEPHAQTQGAQAGGVRRHQAGRPAHVGGAALIPAQIGVATIEVQVAVAQQGQADGFKGYTGPRC